MDFIVETNYKEEVKEEVEDKLIQNKEQEYMVEFAQTNTIMCRVFAKDDNEAYLKGLEILNENTFEENMNISQKGYFECVEIAKYNEEN